MIIHVSDDIQLHFSPGELGLYSYNIPSSIPSHPMHQHTGLFSLLTTVNDKKAEYTQRGVQQANLARRIQNIMMRPSTQRFMDLVSRNMIRNCPITRRHIQASEAIYGPNEGSLRGKTPRQNVGHILGHADAVPPEVLLTHGDVILAIDLMFINQVPFLITISRGLKIGSVTSLANRQACPNICRCLSHVLSLYKRQGFRITTILGDDEFDALVALLPRYQFNICGADEHIPEAERYIRTIKDSVRSQYNSMPYEHIPRAILILRLVENAVFWKNAVPHPDSVTPEFSPCYLLTGKPTSQL